MKFVYKLYHYIKGFGVAYISDFIKHDLSELAIAIVMTTASMYISSVSQKITAFTAFCISLHYSP